MIPFSLAKRSYFIVSDQNHRATVEMFGFSQFSRHFHLILLFFPQKMRYYSTWKFIVNKNINISLGSHHCWGSLCTSSSLTCRALPGSHPSDLSTPWSLTLLIFPSPSDFFLLWASTPPSLCAVTVNTSLTTLLNDISALGRKARMQKVFCDKKSRLHPDQHCMHPFFRWL